jgi:hypothetical protein
VFVDADLCVRQPVIRFGVRADWILNEGGE